MAKKKKRLTTKNTLPKPPVTRLNIIEGDCNGPFKIVTDFCSQAEQAEFDRLYLEWFNHPETKMWCIEAFIVYFKERHPNRACVTHADYTSITKGNIIPATKEEWELENN